MEFINETGCPAELFRTATEDNNMYNSLLVRIRYRLNDGVLEPLTGDQGAKDLRLVRTEDEYGILDPDMFIPRTGTDLIILAVATPPDGPVPQTEVSVSAGPYEMALMVFGNRVWEGTPTGRLKPSPPVPFDVMPITYTNAYGGVAMSRHGAIQNYKNPVGKGYYLQKEDALDHPLPNIEDPAALIQSWQDQPDPVGLGPYPMHWGLRLMNGVAIEEKDGEARAKPLPEKGIFDQAYPRLSGKRLEQGQTVAMEGISRQGISFQLPKNPFEVEIRLGDKVFVRELMIDEVLADMRVFTVEIAYRKLFNYEVVAHMKRETILRWKK